MTGVLEDCETTSAPETRVVGDNIVQNRGHVMTCELWSSDVRLAGTATFVYNSDRDPVDNVDRTGELDYFEVVWGMLRLDLGDDGRWSGMWLGSHDLEGYFNWYELAGVFIGGGDYEGQRIRWTMTPAGPNVSAAVPNARFVFTGTIESLATVPPDGTTLISGSSSCGSSGGTETVVGDVTQGRGFVLTCVGNAGSDPRLDGTTRTVVNGDRALDGTANLWGTEEITVDGAVTWAGDYSGTVAADYTTHRLSGTHIGYGPYVGLVYEWTMIGDPESGYVNRGTIQPAN
ncbi:MAG: hypothetical protein FIA92_15585 [Chloroflexi bacterium]|nr:hypothetical protein [Chloroflexota bacterium]